ncbi:radical SAM protein [Actinopolymorpha sp. B11F2]|uniref:radical SAM protein n=1 Tax=Actinopolymorpha sp. B11F2 TaxID=3160862 RepID=UPI0032E46B1B
MSHIASRGSGRRDGADRAPTYVSADRTLRVKVVDTCGLTYTFCHNEGTPVVTDNLGRVPQAFTSTGRSGRVSIYLGSNGVSFLPATVAPNAEFFRALHTMTEALDLRELHLTGGEPTLHPRLAEVVALGVSAGYRVCMTSNGENGARTIPACAAAGLDRVNFSIFGTTPDELAQVQASKYANPRRAAAKIAALRASIQACADHGVKASANIVVPDQTHAARVRRLLEEFTPDLSVRLLNSLDDGQRSIDAIHGILDDLGGVRVERHITAGASGFRDAYRLDSGRVIYFKQIRPVRLPVTCTGCRFNNDRDCQEGYYGVRLYRDRAGGFQVGVCIQRMDLCMTLEEFAGSDLRTEILELREAEYRQLAADAA